MSRSVGSLPPPLQGSNFTIQEIWSMSQRSNQVWGVEGYEVPVIHFDHAKCAQDKAYYEQATGKKKPKKPGKLDMNVKRGGAFTYTEKHSLMVPPPWFYNVKQKWISGYQNMRQGDVTPRAQKKLQYKWQNVAADAQNFEKPAAAKAGKINKDAKKNTFIDQITNFHSKKNYPIPSPCSYYMNEKLAKKFCPDHVDIMLCKPKDEKRKTNLPRAERKFILVTRGAEKMPGPGAHDPHEVPGDTEKKVAEKKEYLSYKKFKDKTAEVIRRHKETKERTDTRLNDVIGKLGQGIIPKNPIPLPNDMMTFQKLSILYKDVQLGKASKKKGNGFGCEGRFLASDLEMWKRKSEAYNKGAPDGKTIDLKKDPKPGPAHYSLIASWPGKKMKMKKKTKGDDDDKKLPNIFKTMSKGPEINFYYKP